ncbi:unnamed protein product [Closterium sp. NIES-54]
MSESQPVDHWDKRAYSPGPPPATPTAPSAVISISAALVEQLVARINALESHQAMSIDGSSYARGVAGLPLPGEDRRVNSERSFTFDNRQASAPAQDSQHRTQSETIATMQTKFVLSSKLKTSVPFDSKDFYTWSFEFELLATTAQIWMYYDGSLPFPTEGTIQEKNQYYHESLLMYTTLLRNLSPSEQLGIRSYKPEWAVAYAVKQRPLRQIDVGSALLYAPVNAIIFVEQPHAFEECDGTVCLLQKSLYGIEQAPRLWQQYLHTVLTELGFKQLLHDLGMYRKELRGKFILLVAYVDDLLYTGDDTELLDQFEEDIKEKLEVTINHNVTQFRGLNITQSATSIHLSAAKYAEALAKKFAVPSINLTTPYHTPPPNHEPDTTLLSIDDHRLYQQQLGCLLFVAVTCRPDLSYVASKLAQYLKRPEGENLLDLRRALQYFMLFAPYVCSTIRSFSDLLGGSVGGVCRAWARARARARAWAWARARAWAWAWACPWACPWAWA